MISPSEYGLRVAVGGVPIASTLLPFRSPHYWVLPAGQAERMGSNALAFGREKQWKPANLFRVAARVSWFGLPTLPPARIA